jgi:hypothetical protein
MSVYVNKSSNSTRMTYNPAVLMAFFVEDNKICPFLLHSSPLQKESFNHDIPEKLAKELNSCNVKSQSYSTLDYMSPYAKDYQILKSEIAEFELLEFDWNDNQANQFDKNIIHNAKLFLELIKRYSIHVSVFPTARESIQFEYEHEDRYCEAEIFIDSVTVFSTNRKNRKIRKNINGYNFIEKSANLFESIFNGYWE